jgi:molybdate transport system ATP-binding protein
MKLELKSALKLGSFNAIYGPSGVGKTSILRMLAGLMKPDEGLIEVDGVKWFDGTEDIHLKPQKRNVGIVFQDYGLFPHMTVEANIRFALQKNQKDTIVDELVEIMALGSLLEQKPQFLSGGQKQRVALARTLVQKPKLLLLDEPLTAIGKEMRDELQQHIKNIHNVYQLTTILVSHNIDEVIKLSDYIIRLRDNGPVVQGSATEVFSTHDNGIGSSLSVQVIDVEQMAGKFFVTVLINGELRKVAYEGEPPVIGNNINLALTSLKSKD